MKSILRNASILGVLLFVSHNCYSQFHVAFEASSINKIGLGYSLSERFWTEFSVYDGYSIDKFSFTPEMVFYYNLVKKERHDIYCGIGGVVNYYTGLTLPIGTQIYPFENFRRLSLNVEFQPILNFGNNGGGIILLANGGFRYCFRDRKRK